MADGEKKKTNMGLIIGLIVVGLLLASGISYFVATKIMSDKAGAAVKREPGVIVRIGDPKEGVIVNVGGVSGGRYLKIAVVLEVAPNKAVKDPKAVNPDEIIIQDAVIQFLRAQKVEQFAPEKQDELKANISKAVNGALGGGDKVYNVYFTNFVLQ